MRVTGVCWALSRLSQLEKVLGFQVMLPAIGGLCEPQAVRCWCQYIWQVCVLLFMGGLMENGSVHEVFGGWEMGRLGAYCIHNSAKLAFRA